VWWIRQAIMHALAAGGGAVRLPIRKARLASQIRSLRSDMSQEQQAEVGDLSVAEALHMDPAEVEAVLRGAAAHTSLDEDEGQADLLRPGAEGAAIPADQEMMLHAFREEVDRLLRHLTPREREVIEWRFGLGSEEAQTLEAVGQRLGISRERVRQIEARVKQKLHLLARARQLNDFLN
jgi:RNA polymerase sigma factor (sigma-70 family)